MAKHGKAGSWGWSPRTGEGGVPKHAAPAKSGRARRVGGIMAVSAVLMAIGVVGASDVSAHDAPLSTPTWVCTSATSVTAQGSATLQDVPSSDNGKTSVTISSSKGSVSQSPSSSSKPSPADGTGYSYTITDLPADGSTVTVKATTKWPGNSDEQKATFTLPTAEYCGKQFTENDASASVSTTPATCDTGEKLVYGDIENATFSGTPDGTEGPGSYDVTATADANHAFTSGDATQSFNGELVGKVTGADCAGPKPKDDVEKRDVVDAPDCTSLTVTTEHQERTRPYTLNGSEWVPGVWSAWVTTSTSKRDATVEECPPTKIDVPAQPASTDDCNPVGVTNNVVWADSLPADSAHVTWTEDSTTHARTAALKGDRVEWSDGTTAPKVFTLPADDGKQCDTPPQYNPTVTADVSCQGITVSATGFPPYESNEDGFVWAFKLLANGQMVKNDQSLSDWSGAIPQGHSDWKPGSFASPDKSKVQVWTLDIYELTGDGYAKVDSRGPWTQEACGVTPPVTIKIDVPATQASVDSCNPVGVTDNVVWKDALPAASTHVKWSEDPKTHARTATLTGSHVVWKDGTTAPKTFTLPADSGQKCVVPPGVIKITAPKPVLTTPTCKVGGSVSWPAFKHGHWTNVTGTGSGTQSATPVADKGYVLANPGKVTVSVSAQLTGDKACPKENNVTHPSKPVTPGKPGKPVPPKDTPPASNPPAKQEGTPSTDAPPPPHAGDVPSAVGIHDLTSATTQGSDSWMGGPLVAIILLLGGGAFAFRRRGHFGGRRG